MVTRRPMNHYSDIAGRIDHVQLIERDRIIIQEDFLFSTLPAL